MCEQNNECDFVGEWVEATGPKDLYVYCSKLDKEYRVPNKITVEVCGECGEPNWITLSA